VGQMIGGPDARWEIALFGTSYTRHLLDSGCVVQSAATERT